MDERLVRGKPTHVAPPGVPLHGVAQEGADGDRLPQEKGAGKRCSCGSA